MATTTASTKTKTPTPRKLTSKTGEAKFSTPKVLGKEIGRTGRNGHFGDDARAVADTTEDLSTLQIRFLRALRRTRSRDEGMSRLDLKAATFHWPHRKGCHVAWIAALKALSPKLVKVAEHEPEAGGNVRLAYSITAAGLARLERAEADAKTAAKTKKV